jgi:hypothetical protein
MSNLSRYGTPQIVPGLEILLVKDKNILNDQHYEKAVEAFLNGEHYFPTDISLQDEKKLCMPFYPGVYLEDKNYMNFSIIHFLLDLIKEKAEKGNAEQIMGLYKVLARTIAEEKNLSGNKKIREKMIRIHHLFFQKVNFIDTQVIRDFLLLLSTHPKPHNFTDVIDTLVSKHGVSMLFVLHRFWEAASELNNYRFIVKLILTRYADHKKPDQAARELANVFTYTLVFESSLLTAMFFTVNSRSKYYPGGIQADWLHSVVNNLIKFYADHYEEGIKMGKSDLRFRLKGQLYILAALRTAWVIGTYLQNSWKEGKNIRRDVITGGDIQILKILCEKAQQMLDIDESPKKEDLVKLTKEIWYMIIDIYGRSPAINDLDDEIVL